MLKGHCLAFCLSIIFWQINIFKQRHIFFVRLLFLIQISNLLICFCSFNLSYPLIEKDTFIENVYIILLNKKINIFLQYI